MWLFESLDVFDNNGPDAGEFFGTWVGIIENIKNVYRCAPPGGGSARCVSAVSTRKNPKIEILKMTVWFVLES